MSILNVFVIISLTACAGKPAKVTEKEVPYEQLSYAGKIARSANLNTVKDQELIYPQDQNDKTRSATSRSLDLAMAAGTANGVFTSGAVSPGMGAGLWVISALLPSPRQVSEEAVSRLFVWMPHQMANNKEEAADLLIRKYVEAVQKALPDHGIERIKSSVRNSGLGGVSVSIKGPKCPDGCIHTLFYVDEPEITKAPSILGGYDAYVWKVKGNKEKSNFIPQGRMYFPIGEKQLTKEERVDFYMGLSAGLPEWAFLYIAPNAKASPVPVIYNTGTPNYFIKPDNKPNQLLN